MQIDGCKSLAGRILNGFALCASMKQALSNSGIRQKDDGTHEIPASVRPDGTSRKTIKVRPGYIPVEDIAKYRPPKARSTEVGETLPIPRASGDSKITAQPKSLVKKSSSTSPVEKPVVGASKLVKSAWSSAGWRDSEEETSIYARKDNVATRTTPERSTVSTIKSRPLHGKTAGAQSSGTGATSNEVTSASLDLLGDSLAQVKLTHTEGTKYRPSQRCQKERNI